MARRRRTLRVPPFPMPPHRLAIRHEMDDPELVDRSKVACGARCGGDVLVFPPPLGRLVRADAVHRGGDHRLVRRLSGAMVVIAIMVLTGYSGMNPWLILPATVILFREVFVSGLREFLGAKAGLLKVTKLAKWKTTAQMVAIAVLFLGTGLEYLNGVAMQGMTPEQYAEAVVQGIADPIRACGRRDCASVAGVMPCI